MYIAYQTLLCGKIFEEIWSQIRNIYNRWYSHESIHPIPKEVGVFTKGCEHLCGSLAMANISQFLLTSCLEYIIPKSWLVIFSHFLKWKIKILLNIILNIKKTMVSWVFISSRIVDPKIVPFFNKLDAQRLLFWANYAHTGIKKPVLINRNRFLRLIVFYFVFVLLSTNSEDRVDVAIFGCVNMFFNFVPKFIFE